MPASLVCIDIDGTLINSRQEVPASAAQAVRASIAAGNVVVLCTGRSLPEIYPNLWDLGFQGVIGGSGAFTRMGTDVIADHRISHADLVAVSSWLDGLGLPWTWQTPTHFHPSPSFMAAFAGTTSPGATGSGTAGTGTGTGTDAGGNGGQDWGPYIRLVTAALRPGIPDTASKGTFMVPTGTRIDPDVVPHLTQGRLRSIAGSVESASGTTCEVLLSGIDKGTALLELAARLGIPAADTVAIGDSVNDLEALRAAGTGVAMGNSSPAVKEAAGRVTTDIDEGGLALALDSLGLTS